MPKRTAASLPSDEGQGRLAVKRGEKGEFPVPERHELARFQTQTPVRSSDDIAEFMSLWDKVAETRDRPRPDAAEIVKQLRKEKTIVLHIHASELRVAKGAVLTLNNPLNRLTFDRITLGGDLVSNGELVLVCDTLTLG